MPETILARTTASRTQPIHVVYGGAHLFNAGTCTKLGELARKAAAENDLQAALNLPAEVAERVSAKLQCEPVEDFRIDFEDGFGIRPDSEEDSTALRAAGEFQSAALPRQCGIRVKAGGRGGRTLRLFLDNCGVLPANFVVTLPKISAPSEVSTLVKALQDRPEIGIEIMIETPEAVRQMRDFVDAAEGRCIAAHFGAYDYLASLGIAAQDLLHPACDFARAQILVQLAGTGIWLSDGATNVLPLRGSNIPAAWQLHYNNTRRALYNGFYQGWDLHPAQIPARLAAVFSFFHDGMEAASARLRNFVTAAAQATHLGGIFDDAATGQGLLNYFLRARACGALTESDLPIEELAKLLGRA
jgi:citrate lyase beta subunit